MRSLSAKPDGSGFSPAMNWNARKVFASRGISNISSPRVGCCAFCSAAILGAIQSNCASDPIEFNLSHSGSRALLAFTRGREVGVDIEQIRNNLDFEALARRFFSA